MRSETTVFTENGRKIGTHAKVKIRYHCGHRRVVVALELGAQATILSQSGDTCLDSVTLSIARSPAILQTRWVIREAPMEQRSYDPLYTNAHAHKASRRAHRLRVRRTATAQFALPRGHTRHAEKERGVTRLGDRHTHASGGYPGSEAARPESSIAWHCSLGTGGGLHQVVAGQPVVTSGEEARKI